MISAIFTPSPPKPVFSRPGRQAVLQRAIGLADEMIRAFGEADASFVAVRLDDRIAAKQRVMATLADAKQRFVDEKARTTETPTPAALREHQRKEAAEIEGLIQWDLPGARGVVEDFLARREPDHALRYAIQLINLPDRVWRRKYGD